MNFFDFYRFLFMILIFLILNQNIFSKINIIKKRRFFFNLKIIIFIIDIFYIREKKKIKL